MKTIIELIKDKCREQPNKIAIIEKKHQLTYAELYSGICEYSNILIQKGVQKNDIVMVVSDDSADIIMKNLAVMKAGGIFLLVDEDIPEERFRFIYNDAKPRFILSTNKFEERALIKICKRESIECIDYEGDISGKCEIDKRENLLDAAYILYTSGTTGEPKGVIISNTSLMVFRNAIDCVVEYSKKDIVFLACTSMTFDISILETIVTLSYGATCALVNKKMKLVPRLIPDYMAETKVNVVQFTPTFFSFLWANIEEGKKVFSFVDKILIGGEIFRPHFFEELRKYTKADIYNCYGPTEATIWATASKITEPNNINLGIPLPGYEIEIDYSLQQEYGEICILGSAVANGYLRRKELTLNRFTINENGKKLYKTGDLGTYDKQGNLIYAGRNDRQVKLNGFRIELDEIEQCIENMFDMINRAIVIKTNRSGKDCLYCYYCSKETIDSSAIFGELEKHLPPYMLPKLFIHIKEIPKMVNGKIDYQRLELENIDEKDSNYNRC